MSRSRLVRRAPLATRLKSYLNPLDYLLYLSEQFESCEWEEYQRAAAPPLGLGCNIVFLIARANSGGRRRDDVFGDGEGRGGGFVWLALFIVHFLTLISVLNAIYTFQRKRRYRLFESSIDVPPSTPSAHRVRVDSSPLSSSPLRFFSTLIDSAPLAESRSHPDPSRDVWEIAVWDPMPLCLRLFCFFSPGHILVYFLLLPITPTDPRPSTTILTAIIFTSLLTVQLLYLDRRHSQQSKDAALIHKEVLHEYDTKYVRPRLNPQVRDAATQFPAEDGHCEVQFYTPTTVKKREFHTHPNPNYAHHVDPSEILKRRSQIPSVGTPFRQPQFRPIHQSTGDGGSLGIYSHANSPLKKSASTNFLTSSDESALRGRERSGSPLKRSSAGGGLNGRAQGGRNSIFGDSSGLGTPGRRGSGRF